MGEVTSTEVLLTWRWTTHRSQEKQPLSSVLKYWSDAPVRPPTNAGVLGKQLLGYRIYIKEPRCSNSRQVNIKPFSQPSNHLDPFYENLPCSSPTRQEVSVSLCLQWPSWVPKLQGELEIFKEAENQELTFQGCSALPPSGHPVRVLGDRLHPEEGGGLVPSAEDEDRHRQARTPRDYQHKLHRCVSWF